MANFIPLSDFGITKSELNRMAIHVDKYNDDDPLYNKGAYRIDGYRFHAQQYGRDYWGMTICATVDDVGVIAAFVNPKEVNLVSEYCIPNLHSIIKSLLTKLLSQSNTQ